MTQGRKCTVHNERNARGQCVPCNKIVKKRFYDKKRERTAEERWPCIQCGCPIGWSTRGGNRLTICKECAPNLRYRMLVQRYGVDKNMFEAMYFDQDGKCAIPSCHREAKCVDHDHVTGNVRGLLCQGCNGAIGFLESDVWVQGVREYLRG